MSQEDFNFINHSGAEVSNVIDKFEIEIINLVM